MFLLKRLFLGISLLLLFVNHIALAAIQVTSLYEVVQGSVVLTAALPSPLAGEGLGVRGSLQVSNQYIYSPYGMQRNIDYLSASRSLNITQNQFGYTGQAQDPSTHLMMLGRFRNYAPGIGRFIQPDTYNSFTKTHVMNPYGYVKANPLKNVDLNGHSPLVIGITAASVAIGLLGGGLMTTAILGRLGAEASLSRMALAGGIGGTVGSLLTSSVRILGGDFLEHEPQHWQYALKFTAISAMMGGVVGAFGGLTLGMFAKMPARTIGQNVFRYVAGAAGGIFSGGSYSLGRQELEDAVGLHKGLNDSALAYAAFTGAFMGLVAVGAHDVFFVKSPKSLSDLNTEPEAGTQGSSRVAGKPKPPSILDKLRASIRAFRDSAEGVFVAAGNRLSSFFETQSLAKSL